jgi:hypothetical protein
MSYAHLYVDKYEILLILFSVKHSSATDAYLRPDLDDRPKFNVVIIYEDIAAGKLAKHFYDRVIRELVDEAALAWNFGTSKSPIVNSQGPATVVRWSARRDSSVANAHVANPNSKNRRLIADQDSPASSLLKAGPTGPVQALRRCL